LNLKHEIGFTLPHYKVKVELNLWTSLSHRYSINK